MALLEVNDVHAAYGTVVALRGVSLKVEAGEKVALLGANGAGKTTTLRTLSGMLAPTKGEVVFDGKQIGGFPAYKVVGEGVSHVPEGRELFTTMTVEENLRYGFWPRHTEKSRYEPQLERIFGMFPRLKERRKQASGTLSGGEQQMLVIGRALMSSPRLLMVDELSLGLAPIVVSQLFDILEEVNSEGTAVLIVEQFVDMSLSHTDRAYVLSKGQVVLEGPSSQLKESPEVLSSYLGSEVEEPEKKPKQAAKPRAKRKA